MFFHAIGKNGGWKPRGWTFCRILFLACKVTMSSQLHSPVPPTSLPSTLLGQALLKHWFFKKINLLCSKRDSQGNLLFCRVALKQNTKESTNIFVTFNTVASVFSEGENCIGFFFVFSLSVVFNSSYTLHIYNKPYSILEALVLF